MFYGFCCCEVRVSVNKELVCSSGRVCVRRVTCWSWTWRGSLLWTSWITWWLFTTRALRSEAPLNPWTRPSLWPSLTISCLFCRRRWSLTWNWQKWTVHWTLTSLCCRPGPFIPTGYLCQVKPCSGVKWCCCCVWTLRSCTTQVCLLYLQTEMTCQKAGGRCESSTSSGTCPPHGRDFYCGSRLITRRATVKIRDKG